MHISMLPDAIQREREVMLKDGVETLRQMGNVEFAVHDLAGFREPDELAIPILNVHMQPDIVARRPGMPGATLALVEPSSDLGEESCGRRWQAFETWAHEHDAQVVVFVHPEDQTRAQEIARYWHVPAEHIMSLPRVH